jgi:hypothetical protein
MKAASPEMTERVKYKGETTYIYRIYLRDKQGTPYSVERPSRFLSRSSIERRRRQQLPIDSTDLPVNPNYIKQLQRKGANIVGQSRWHNTLLVSVKDSLSVHAYGQLPCVQSYKLVWQAPDSINPTAQRTKYQEHFEEHFHSEGQYYGVSYDQIVALQGQRLHDIGMLGD